MADSAKDKKTNTNLIIAIVVLVLILVGIFIYKHNSKADDLPPYVPPANPGNASTPTSNDSFPLKEGSKGTNVKYLQNAINKIVDKANLNNNLKLTVDGSFGHQTYLSLVTGVGTSINGMSIYPVSLAAFTDILKKANS